MSFKSELKLLSIDELLINMNFLIINNLYTDIQISNIDKIDYITMNSYGRSRLLSINILQNVEELFNNNLNLIIKHNITTKNWYIYDIQNIVRCALITINNICNTITLLYNHNEKYLQDAMKYIDTIITILHDQFILPIITRGKIDLFDNLIVSKLNFNINFDLLPTDPENIEIINNIKTILQYYN